MKRLLTGFAIFLVFFSFCSCAHNYYVASPTNIPLLTHKGDAKATIDVVYGTRSFIHSDATGFNFSGSYAISNKFGIMGSGAMMGNKEDNEQGVEKYRLNNFEIGLGSINTKIDQSFLFEFFAGSGYITQQHLYNYESINKTLEAGTIKFFLQPNIALKKESFSLSFSPKFVFVNNYDVSHNFDPSSSAFLSYYRILQIEQNDRTVYFEPAIDFTAGPRLVKFKFQAKYIEALERIAPNHPKLMISMGIQLELDELFSGNDKEQGVEQYKLED